MTPDQIVTDPAARRAAVLDVIRGARHTISLSLFRCTDREIFDELATAAARGVAVDALVTSRAKGGRKKLEKLCRALEHAKVAVSQYSEPVVKYHAKYLVADDGPSLVTSLNFTKKCFTKTLDALVVTHDPDVASGLRRLLKADREAQPLPEALTDRLVVGPERARRQLTTIIEQAQRSIRLIDAKLSDPEIVSLLQARRRAGVEVEIFNAKRLGELKSHGKILLADNRIAVVGSLALAALSLDFRREVALSVEDPAAIAGLARLFDAIASAAPPRSPDVIDQRGAVPC